MVPFRRYPEAKKRIICISDGLDTKSASTGSQDVCWRLKRAEIAVDSVCLGDESNLELRTISHLLGCYRFHPTSLVNALAICEMEPFLSLTERPPISAPPRTPRHRLQFMGHFWQARYAAEPTLVTNDDVPPRKEHPNLRDEFVQLKAITARPGNVANSGNARSNLRISRLMTEMRLIVGNGAHPKYDIYVSETDMSFWKVVMDGPDESPYSAGTFLLYLHADDGYPTFAPKARFITKIKHPNVNAHGRICHSIFDRDWTSDINMTTLLDTVYGLLYQPEHSDPVNTAITLGFHHDQVEFAEEVREHVGRFAGKTRAGWKRELLGENEDEEMES